MQNNAGKGPSREAKLINELFRNMPKGGPEGYLKEREEARKRPKPPLPAGVTLREMELGGNYAELIEKPDNDGPLILYIHGGGFKTGSAQERRELTFTIVDQYGSNVIANNYRLAPENKWPAALEDCVNTYRAILELGYAPEHMVVAGESAGGTLVLGTLLYLRDHQIPLPKAAVVYSPGINNATRFRSHTENAGTDYMLGDSVADEREKEQVFGSGAEGEALRRNPYASPYFADFIGICPIFIAASDAEALYDDARILHDKLMEAGVETELYIGHDLIHAYPLFQNLPETADTLQRTFSFLHKK